MHKAEQDSKNLIMINNLDLAPTHQQKTFKISHEEMKVAKEKSIDAQVIRLATVEHPDEKA